MIAVKIISSTSRLHRTELSSIILHGIAVKLLCDERSDSCDFYEPLC